MSAQSDFYSLGINRIKGSAKSTSADAETTYDALSKYGVDLVQLAFEGKLDPVIGQERKLERIIQVCCAPGWSRQ